MYKHPLLAYHWFPCRLKVGGAKAERDICQFVPFRKYVAQVSCLQVHNIDTARSLHLCITIIVGAVFSAILSMLLVAEQAHPLGPAYTQ